MILTPGRYNAAYFEHSYLAEKSGAVLAMNSDLEVRGDYLYYRDFHGNARRVGAVYRRISDDYLDPMTFKEESLIGIPHIMDIYRKGNVAVINAPGNGIADDKGIYYFVPKMIEYYLHERPDSKKCSVHICLFTRMTSGTSWNISIALLLKTWRRQEDMESFSGSSLSEERRGEFKETVRRERRRFIAQEVIDFLDIDIMDGQEIVPRKADLRAFVLSGKETKVWASGLTRFSRVADSFIVNSSQGGGFKDTWVLSQ